MSTDDKQGPGILSKSQLTIDLVDERCVAIRDGNGNRRVGGNLRAKAQAVIRFINETRYPCRLYFTELLPDDDDRYGGATWPFEGSAPIDSNGVEIPGRREAEGPNHFTGKLRADAVPVVKYDVIVLTGAPNPPALDPVIIVRV